MADEATPQTPTGEEQGAAPSTPTIDMSDYERLKTFHDSYNQFISEAEPYANTVVRLVRDPQFRTLVESADKASEALKPTDDTPEYARKILKDVESVRADLDKEKSERAQAQAVSMAQNRILKLAESYPAIAENDYKIANDIAAKLKDRNITMDQFVDTLEAVAPILSRPAPEVKRPPSSTRADAGVPAVSNTPQETFANNKERGKAIDK